VQMYEENRYSFEYISEIYSDLAVIMLFVG